MSNDVTVTIAETVAKVAVSADPVKTVTIIDQSAVVTLLPDQKVSVNVPITPTTITLVPDPIVTVGVTNTPVTVTLGTSGPQGGTGVPGATGAPGSAVGAFVYPQNTPSNVWTINHNLNMYPIVVVLDSANSQCEGTITYNNANTLTITFSSAFSGIAYLN